MRGGAGSARPPATAGTRRPSLWPHRCSQGPSDPDDRYKLKQAVALDGLNFDQLPTDQCARLAVAVERAADELRAEFPTASPQATETSPIDSTRFGLSLSDLTGS